MADNAKALPWVCNFRDHSGMRLLSLFRELAHDDWSRAMSSGLAVEPLDGGGGRLLMEVPPRTAGQEFEAADAYIDRLLAIFSELGMPFNAARAKEFHKMDLDGTLDPFKASIFLASQSLHDGPVDQDGLGPADGEDLLVILDGESEERLAADVATLHRYGRDHRMIGVAGLEGSKKVVGILLSDAARDYGNFSAYLGRSDVTSHIRVLRGSPAGSHRLWSDVPPGRAIDPDALAALRVVLDRAVEAGVPPFEGEPAFLATGQREGLFCFVKDPNEAAATFDAPLHIEPVQAFKVQAVSLARDQDTIDRLRRKIEHLSPAIGYEVRLVSMRRGLGPNFEVDRLRQEIDELQLQIDQVTAFSAPQKRLLRFSDAQLGAMVDGLRSLPVSAVKEGNIHYAAGHSAGRDEPVHYLHYDPSEQSLHLAELLWQSKTGDPHPMTYWLEPFVAKGLADRPGRASVYVPVGKFLQPSLAHFGGNIDQTLREVLGGLFHSVSELVTAPDSRPAFIFSPWLGGGFSMEVEVLDMAAFAPLQIQLPWINDYLQVRSAQTLNRDDLAQIAAQVYVSDFIMDQKNALHMVQSQVRDEWNSATTKLREEAIGMVRALDDEMRGGIDRIARVRSYIEKIRDEIFQLEKVMAAAEQALDGHLAIAEELEIKDQAMRRARERFVDRVTNEMLRGEAELSRIGDRISNLKRLLAAATGRKE